jgi:hypothetical protein
VRDTDLDYRFRLPILSLEETPALPPGHKFGTKVPGGPNGGARCSTCKFYDHSAGPHGLCRNVYFQTEMGTNMIPEPAAEYCCDVWDQ